MTDILEKCARAASDEIAQQVHGDGSKSVESLDVTGIVRAVIATLADGVTEEMVARFRAQWDITEFRAGETVGDTCARGISAAIRAAIPEGK